MGALATVSGGAKTQASDRNGGPGSSKRSSFVEILRVPDSVTLYGGFLKTSLIDPLTLARSGEQWTNDRCVVETRAAKDSLVLTLTADKTPVSVVHVRWTTEVRPNLIALGDAWERSYGDLGWRNVEPERAMPWYFATYDGTTCHGYGVRTDARALCFWQLDQEGVSLWLNVMNGGSRVALGERQLVMATVTSRPGQTARRHSRRCRLYVDLFVRVLHADAAGLWSERLVLQLWEKLIRKHLEGHGIHC